MSVDANSSKIEIAMLEKYENLLHRLERLDPVCQALFCLAASEHVIHVGDYLMGDTVLRDALDKCWVIMAGKPIDQIRSLNDELYDKLPTIDEHAEYDLEKDTIVTCSLAITQTIKCLQRESGAVRMVFCTVYDILVGAWQLVNPDCILEDDPLETEAVAPRIFSGELQKIAALVDELDSGIPNDIGEWKIDQRIIGKDLSNQIEVLRA